MPTALIGHTGYVGANLLAQAHFDEKYDVRNAADLRGREFSLAVCAAVPSAKWKADVDPQADEAAVRALTDTLREVRAEKFLLLSTIEVYGRPEMVDEDSPPEPVTAYGRHRLALEQFCRERFSATVLRLPLLFGPGLKKNPLFDLMQDHKVDALHPDSVFQYYGVAHLWRDANIALERGLPLLNVACEPIPTRELALRCFGRELSTYPPEAPVVRDVRSKLSELWGGTPFGYLYAKEKVLGEISDFLDHERAL